MILNPEYILGDRKFRVLYFSTLNVLEYLKANVASDMTTNPLFG